MQIVQYNTEWSTLATFGLVLMNTKIIIFKASSNSRSHSSFSLDLPCSKFRGHVKSFKTHALTKRKHATRTIAHKRPNDLECPISSSNSTAPNQCLHVYHQYKSTRLIESIPEHNNDAEHSTLSHKWVLTLSESFSFLFFLIYGFKLNHIQVGVKFSEQTYTGHYRRFNPVLSTHC